MGTWLSPPFCPESYGLYHGTESRGRLVRETLATFRNLGRPGNLPPGLAVAFRP